MKGKNRFITPGTRRAYNMREKMPHARTMLTWYTKDFCGTYQGMLSLFLIAVMDRFLVLIRTHFVTGFQEGFLVFFDSTAG